MSEKDYESPSTQQSPEGSAPSMEDTSQGSGFQRPVPPVTDATQRDTGGTTADDRRRSRRWWWIVGIVLIVLLLACGCLVPTYLATRGGGTSRVDFGSIGRQAVAVIRVDGVIAGTGDYYSGYITPEYFLDKLQQAEDDDRVKAIVLRVDSPGGTVAASEEIAEYVRTSPKPIVVSIGDVGASGAYMLASQSDEIWAMPGSTVGSIGVITEIPNVSGLLDKLGVEFQVITAGKYKDAGSPYRELTKEEQALIKGQIDEAYQQFIDIVADGRDMSVKEVTELATGWAWSGSRARQLGLVDKIGTYQQALDAAADLGGIEADYDVVTYEDQFGDLLSPLLSLSSRLGGLDALGRAGQPAQSAVPR